MPALREVATRNQSAGRPRSQLYRIAHRIADRFEPRVAEAVVRAIVSLQDSIDLDDLASAVASGSLTQIEAAIQASRLGQLLQGRGGLEDTLHRTATTMGRAGADVLTGATGVQAQFNARDLTVVLFAREQSANLVTGVGEEAREAIRIIVAAGQEFGLTTRQQARAIREVVGLPHQWARAPLNLARDIREGREASALSRKLSAVDKAKIRSRMRRGSVTEEFVESMQRTYARRLTNLRSRTIARTETMAAANNGMRTGWRQARDDGVLPATARRHVIVTPDERLRGTHAAVPRMNEGGVGLDEPFNTPWGKLQGPPWAADPYNCRCSEGLSFPGLRGKL